METFTMFRYWRGGRGGAGDGGESSGSGGGCVSATTPTTITAASSPPSSEPDNENDDGPFIDLDLTDDTEDGEGEEEEHERNNSSDEEAASEGFDFTMFSALDRTESEPNLSLSSSETLLVESGLVPLDSSTLAFNSCHSGVRSHLPVSLQKTATKFRVLLLGFKKQKSQEEDGSTQKPQQHFSKFFAVKFRGEEARILSLFTRDSSSRSTFSMKSRREQEQADPSSADGIPSSEMKRFSKEALHKYLKMIKPLPFHVKGSSREGDRSRLLGGLSSGKEGIVPGAATSGLSDAKSKGHKDAYRPSRLPIVRRHLVKGPSASAPGVTSPTRTRDGTQWQQQDAIQGAILHCKRSLNVSAGCQVEPCPPSHPHSATDTRRLHEAEVDVCSSRCIDV